MSPPIPGSRADRIATRLSEALAPATVTVRDESMMHAGHSGVDAAGETHFRVRIVSAAFGGRSRVARHRQVMDLLAAEFATGLHALALEARTPDEAMHP